MRVIKINTTAWEEEDFYLVTTLDDNQISDIIQPIVSSSSEYDNETLVNALKKEYPFDFISVAEFDQLIFTSL
jgi:hypothetical protein